MSTRRKDEEQAMEDWKNILLSADWVELPHIRIFGEDRTNKEYKW